MRSIRFLVLPALATLLASCASKTNQDTDPYGTPDAGQADVTQNPNAPYGGDPTYDTPAAYEDAGNTPAPADHGVPSVAPDASGGGIHSGHAATSHKVGPGDSLSKIAKQYGVPVAAIKAANNMSNDTVVLGKTLRIPAGGAGGTAANAASHSAGGKVHVVGQGDTLGKIAAKYGVSSAAIKQANRMTSDTVVLGKKLIIPTR